MKNKLSSGKIGALISCHLAMIKSTIIGIDFFDFLILPQNESGLNRFCHDLKDEIATATNVLPTSIDIIY